MSTAVQSLVFWSLWRSSRTILNSARELPYGEQIGSQTRRRKHRVGSNQGRTAVFLDVLGPEIVMNLGWVMTLSSGTNAPVQVSIATEGGSGMEVSDLAIEVDNFDMAYRRMRADGF